MTHWTTIRTFNTHRFAVALQWAYEESPDLSWMDDDMRAKLQTGELAAYCFRVVVSVDGRIVGADYLGDSVYEYPEAFAREHYGIKPLGRLHDVTYCVYFPDMVRAAIAEARTTIRVMPRMRGAA
jgi:hypothetical protein